MNRFLITVSFLIGSISLIAADAISQYGIELVNCYESGDMSYYTKSGGGFYGYYTKAQSELVYPLANYSPGLRLFMKRTKEDGRRTELSAEFTTNVMNPNEIMTDSDWLSDNFSEPPVYNQLFSYTESDVDMQSYNLNLELKSEYLVFYGIHFGLMGGFEWHKYEYDVLGLEGWQCDPYHPENRVEFDTLAGDVVGTYDAQFRAIYIGTSIAYPINNFDFFVDFKITPFANNKGIDNHVLRTLKIEMETEEALYYRTDVQVSYSLPTEKLDLLITAKYDYTKYDLEGKASFKYYDGESADEDAKDIKADFQMNRSCISLNFALLL